MIANSHPLFVPCPAHVHVPDNTPKSIFRPIPECINTALLDPSAVDDLVALGNGTLPSYPTFMISRGRSMHAELRAEVRDRFGGISGTKMKGLRGVRNLQNGSYEVVAPEPLSRYGTGFQPHLVVDRDLNFRVEMASEKGLFSLTEKGAVNEYKLGEALSKANIGLRGLLAGAYWMDEKQRVVDFKGQPTGAVFLESPPDLKELLSYLEFYLIQSRPNGPYHILLPENGYAPVPCADPREPIIRFMRTSVQIGVIKRASAEEAHVGRHASHLNNLRINPYDESSLRMTDIDSCINYEELQPYMWGPQLLRDLASDILRNLSSFSFYAFSECYLEGVDNGSMNGFFPYLKGFFGGDVAADNIERVAQELHEQYFDHAGEHLDMIITMSSERNAAALTHQSSHVRKLLGGWMMLHAPLVGPILEGCYQLLHESWLKEGGFTLPTIDDQTRKVRFGEAANNLHAAYESERRRQRKKGLI